MWGAGLVRQLLSQSVSLRLSEMLSSTLRFHLGMIFAEEEGGGDALLESIRSRVRESAAAYGSRVVGVEGEEQFAAVISKAMLRLWQHAPLVAPENEVSARGSVCVGGEKSRTCRWKWVFVWG